MPEDAKTNDLGFCSTHPGVDGLDDFVDKLREQRAKFVSSRVAALPGAPSGTARSLVVRDPDGHALQFIEREPGAGQVNR